VNFFYVQVRVLELAHFRWTRTWTISDHCTHALRD